MRLLPLCARVKAPFRVLENPSVPFAAMVTMENLAASKPVMPVAKVPKVKVRFAFALKVASPLVELSESDQRLILKGVPDVALMVRLPVLLMKS